MPRMADFARVLAALDTACPELTGGSALDLFSGQRQGPLPSQRRQEVLRMDRGRNGQRVGQPTILTYGFLSQDINLRRGDCR